MILPPIGGFHVNITQLMQYISPELICQVVYPQNIDYLDIRLLCGAETEFINNCIYLGSLANKASIRINMLE